MTRRALVTLLASAVVLGMTPAPASAFDVSVSRVAVTSSRVIATLELRELLRDQFLQVVQQGRAVFVQVQADLWENRRLADRLALTTPQLTYRIDRAIDGGVVLVDQFGTRTEHPDIAAPLPMLVDLGPETALADDRSYYVRAAVTAATVAERDLQQAGAAFLGDPQSAEGLAGLGRFVFRTLLRIGQYLDTAAATATSRTLSAAAIRAGQK